MSRTKKQVNARWSMVLPAMTLEDAASTIRDPPKHKRPRMTSPSRLTEPHLASDLWMTLRCVQLRSSRRRTFWGRFKIDFWRCVQLNSGIRTRIISQTFHVWKYVYIIYIHIYRTYIYIYIYTLASIGLFSSTLIHVNMPYHGVLGYYSILW